MKNNKFTIAAVSICFVLIVTVPCYLKESSDSEGQIKEILVRLEKKMSDIETLRAEFIQKKDLKMFEQIVSIEGTLFIQKPKRFAWHTEKPMRYSLVLEDGKARQWDASSGNVETMSLKEKPDINTVITRIKDRLEGHFIHLQDQYRVKIKKEVPLKLDLYPLKSTYVHEMIEHIELTFEENERYIDSVEILDTEGNKTSIEFTEININTEIDPKAWEVGRGVR